MEMDERLDGDDETETRTKRIENAPSTLLDLSGDHALRVRRLSRPKQPKWPLTARKACHNVFLSGNRCFLPKTNNFPPFVGASFSNLANRRVCCGCKASSDHLKTREALSRCLRSLQAGVVCFTVVEAFVREDKSHAPVLGPHSSPT